MTALLVREDKPKKNLRRWTDLTDPSRVKEVEDEEDKKEKNSDSSYDY